MIDSRDYRAPRSYWMALCKAGKRTLLDDVQPEDAEHMEWRDRALLQIRALRRALDNTTDPEYIGNDRDRRNVFAIACDYGLVRTEE